MEIIWSITSNQHEENQNIRNNGNLTIATFMIKEREDMMKLELEEDDDTVTVTKITKTEVNTTKMTIIGNGEQMKEIIETRHWRKIQVKHHIFSKKIILNIQPECTHI